MRRRTRSSRFFAIAAMLLPAASPGILRAQDAPVQDAGAPERGVARISIANGEVSVRRGDSGDWVAAVVNAPLMVGDRIATGAGSRAEVQFDSANLIRIGAHAEIRLAQLDYGHYHVQIGHGTVSYRMLRESQAQVEVDTPILAVRPSHIGAYRIYVKEDGQTEVTVRLGTVEIFTPKGSEQLQAGQTMLARGNPADPEFRIVPAIAYDEWDRWNEQRDHEMQNSVSYRNVPQDVYGAEDLDNHGQWVNDPAYGEVWNPAVGPDWAPYQNGRWVWEDYYGWTWVSSDPWGWAPFHYGRWYYAAPWGWCWYPGGIGLHYWSPGLVAFFGFGPSVGVGFGFGNVGWVALAPFERIYPWWGRGVYAGFRNPAYFNRGVNLTTVSVANTYRNARVSNAVASVSATDFRQGRFGNIARASGAQIREAGLVRGPLPMAPSAASLRFSNRTVAGTPRSSENTHFFSHNSPAPVQRVPFADQQRSMQQFSRQPASVAARSATGSGTSGAWRSVSTPAAAGGSAASSGGAWRPVNTPSAATRNAGTPISPDRGSGWQRFGEPRAATPAASRSYAQPVGLYRPPAPSGVSGASRPQSIRVAPPVVREKPAARSESSGKATRGTGGGGGGSHSSGGGSHGGGHR